MLYRYWACHFLRKYGAKVVGVTEYNGGIVNEEGINTEDLKKYFVKVSVIPILPNPSVICIIVA